MNAMEFKGRNRPKSPARSMWLCPLLSNCPWNRKFGEIMGDGGRVLKMTAILSKAVSEAVKSDLAFAQVTAN